MIMLMGGVGKTTIMTEIRNRYSKETCNFNDVIRVPVSKAFNIRTLQREIAKSRDIDLSNDQDETRRASELYAILFRRKNYVLIFGDLWEAFNLENARIPEPTKSNGCKLVLTTQSLEGCRAEPSKWSFSQSRKHSIYLNRVFAHDVVIAPEVEEIAT